MRTPSLQSSADVRPLPEDTLNDESLALAYLSGRPEAFSVLLKRYRRPIYFLIRYYFRDPEKTEEVFQDVFLKLFEKMHSYDGRGPFRSWFYSLCRNHCIDQLRRQKRRPECIESQWNDEGETAENPVARTPDPQASPEDQAYRRQIASCIDEVVMKLPEEQRETFLLKERGGLTYEEIAQLMEVSPNTVKSRLRYALESLRRGLRHKAFVQEALS